MFLKRVTKGTARVAAAGATLLVSTTASAQSCAMCYNNAAAAKASAIRALQSGILLLLIPPLLIFIGIFVVAFRGRNRFNDQDFREPGHEQEWNEGLATKISSGFESARFEYRYPVA